MTEIISGHGMELPSKYFTLYPGISVLSASAKGTSLCNGWQLMQRLITGQRVEMKQTVKQNVHIPAPRLRSNVEESVARM